MNYKNFKNITELLIKKAEKQHNERKIKFNNSINLP